MKSGCSDSWGRRPPGPPALAERQLAGLSESSRHGKQEQNYTSELSSMGLPNLEKAWRIQYHP